MPRNAHQYSYKKSLIGVVVTGSSELTRIKDEVLKWLECKLLVTKM